MTPPIAADLYCDVPYPAARADWRRHGPGLIIVLLGTLASAFIAKRYGTPLTLVALLIGLSLSFLSSNRQIRSGLDFAAHNFLRWGIVLIGLQVTAHDLVALGAMAMVGIAGIMMAVMAVGLFTARKLGYNSAFGLLAAGAVAICGASAAMAFAGALGKKRIPEAQLTIVLVCICSLSASAMVLYPMVAHLLKLTDQQAGFFLGGSIHDVAQAIGAGYAFSDAAGGIAAISKLTRVALLTPILACLPLAFPDNVGSRSRRALPLFIIGFLGMAAVNSMVYIPMFIRELGTDSGSWLLASAVTATAIRSPIEQITQAGIKPFIVMFAATIAGFAASLGFAILMLR
ncbi:hypothetical protein WSK_1300 [Novosphingobium sp. Rr 2-17]|uniref:YeiH family protein n=1 Tax=Novosphingobium sp. Rr 2-17 TaxID=555793 RepID=UPI0002697E8E|nr:putative sulfate exporter family transporter [Novosphingobium sp. Rr 2-17]EIZ80106.1 hypothetical protein WSK_1300 [Novosphingobium sp. Rr 2-17]